MKNCISRIISLIIHLWRTISKHVRRRDVTGDGKPDIIITTDNECHNFEENKLEEDNSNDT